MQKIGIFFGSDTGNTKRISEFLQKELQPITTDVYDIAQSTPEDLKSFENLILGISTWYYGELQCDWEDFIPELENITFANKKVAIFGCGDQEDYADYFCDGIGQIYNVVKSRNGNLIGKWPTEGYSFRNSKALLNKNYFAGLPIDEDRQPELTQSRVKLWAKQIKHELEI